MSHCTSRTLEAIHRVEDTVRFGRCSKSAPFELERVAGICDRQLSRGLARRAERAIEQYQASCGAYLSGARRRRRRRR